MDRDSGGAKLRADRQTVHWEKHLPGWCCGRARGVQGRRAEHRPLVHPWFSARKTRRGRRVVWAQKQDRDLGATLGNQQKERRLKVKAGLSNKDSGVKFPKHCLRSRFVFPGLGQTPPLREGWAGLGYTVRSNAYVWSPRDRPTRQGTDERGSMQVAPSLGLQQAQESQLKSRGNDWARWAVAWFLLPGWDAQWMFCNLFTCAGLGLS